MTTESSLKIPLQNRPSRRKLTLYITLMVCILTAAAVAIIQMNSIVIGGSDYIHIKHNSEALQQTARINSNLHQIINEVRPIMHDADKGAAITMARLIAIDTDRKFVSLQELVKTPGMRDTINKAEANWREYKKTLLEEIVPAAGKGDKLKIAYLTTGIQAQRMGMMDKNLNSLSEKLNSEIAETEQRAVDNRTIRIAAAAVTTCAVLALAAYLAMVFSDRLGGCFRPLPHPGMIVENRRDQSGSGEPDTGASTAASAVTSIAAGLSDTCRQLEDSLAASNDQGTAANTELLRAKETLDAQMAVLTDLREALNKLGETDEESRSDLTQLVMLRQNLVTQSEHLELKARQLSSAIAEADSCNGQSINTISDLSRTVPAIAAMTSSLSESFRQIITGAENSCAVTEALGQDAEHARKAALETRSSFKRVIDPSLQASRAIHELLQQKDELARVASVFDEMREQVEILSLNATITASQAGEPGKCFSRIVAEIQELATLADNATQALLAALHGITRETALAAESLKLLDAGIAAGEQHAGEAGMTIAQLVISIQQSCFQLRELAAGTAAQEQIVSQAAKTAESMSQQVASFLKAAELLTGHMLAIGDFAGDLDEAAADMRTTSFKQDSIMQSACEISASRTQLQNSIFTLSENLFLLAEQLAENINRMQPAVQTANADQAEQLAEIKRQIALLRRVVPDDRA